MTAGKLRRLMTLADASGRFQMLAIDQRTTLRVMLARACGKPPEEIEDRELTEVKARVTEALGPFASAVLTDPVYGWPATLRQIPGSVGLLLALEDATPELTGPGGRERRSRRLEEWAVAKFAEAGASAVKLLLPFRPDASVETNNHQKALAHLVGAECQKHEMPFLLELIGYPLAGEETDTPEYARRKPEVVIESAREFSRPEFAVDLLKLEFPAELKWCREYSRGTFDSQEREPVYDREQVGKFCRAVDAVCGAPWVLLSAGVSMAEFLVDLELATAAGASGFLCGRALWQEAIAHYDDLEKLSRSLDKQGTINFQCANAVAEAATPWFEHRSRAGADPFAMA
jgi:tagatose 1,6-diphosphate aldolase